MWSEQEVPGLTLPNGNGIQHPAYFAAIGDVTTADEGTFTIERVPAWGVHLPGVYTASASQRRLGRMGVVAAGYAIETRELNVPTEGEVVDVELRVTSAGSVRGRLVRRTGEPAAGASVWWRYPTASPWTWIPPVFAGLDLPPCVSDANGRYALPQIPARRAGVETIEVQASPPGASPWAYRPSVEVTPRAGETVEAPDLTLGSLDPDGPSAVVTVVDEAGRPIWGATFEGCFPGASTDEGGRARLFFDSGLSEPRDTTVSVRGPGRERVTSPAIALATGTLPKLRVVLGPRRPPSSAPAASPATEVAAEPQGYAVEGTIRDARTGRPILKWDVSLRGSGPDRPTARSVGPGRFRFEGVAAGTWELDVRAEGYDPERRESFRVGSDVVAESLDVRLATGVVVRGRLLDESGVPLGGARVFFNGQGVPSVDGDISPDGRFSVRGFRPDGRYAIWVARDDGRGGMAYWVCKPFEDLHVTGDATTADRELTVASAGALELVVEAEALGSASTVPTQAQIAAGAATRFTFENAATTTVWKSVGIWQRQRANVLPVGRWKVRVEVPGSPTKEVEFVIEAGKSAKTAIEIP